MVKRYKLSRGRSKKVFSKGLRKHPRNRYGTERGGRRL